MLVDSSDAEECKEEKVSKQRQVMVDLKRRSEISTCVEARRKQKTHYDLFRARLAVQCQT